MGLLRLTLSLPARLSQGLRRFGRGERGSISVEMLLVIPLLAWCFLGTYTFFAAYRTSAINVKAAYTIGDQLSRETDFITPNYMVTMGRLHDFLVNQTTGTRLRVSVITYQQATDRYLVVWSQGIDQGARATGSAVTDVRSNLPVMPDGEVAILTETWIEFTPDDFVGMPDSTFHEAIVTRPRFANQLCWNPVENGNALTGVCDLVI